MVTSDLFRENLLGKNNSSGGLAISLSEQHARIVRDKKEFFEGGCAWIEISSIFAADLCIGHLTQLVQSVTLTGWKSLVRVQ